LLPLYNFVSCLRAHSKSAGAPAHSKTQANDHGLEVTATFWSATLLRGFVILR